MDKSKRLLVQRLLELDRSQRARRYLLIVGVLLLVVLIVFSGFVVISRQKSRNSRVLVYLGNEFSFVYDLFLPAGYLTGGYTVTRDFGTLRNVSSYDVVVIEQSTTNLNYTLEQRQMLVDYVRHGGGLLLIGNAGLWRSANPKGQLVEYPMNFLSSAFGASFSTEGVDDLTVVKPGPLTGNVNAFQVGDDLPVALVLNGTYHSLVTDDQGRAFIAYGKFGSGHVVLSGDDSLVSNPSSSQPLINYRLVRNVFDWLAVPMIGTGGTPPAQILPEGTLNVLNSTIYYPQQLQSTVYKVVGKLFPVYTELKALFKTAPAVPMQIIMLPANGSGFSTPGVAGIGVFSAGYTLVDILAHEMTTSFLEPPLAPHYMEGWNVLAGIMVARDLGYQSEANASLQTILRAFNASDPSGTALDITKVPSTYPDDQPYLGKFIFLTLILEKTYGKDIMSWYVKYSREYSAQLRLNGTIPDSAVVALLSVAVDHNLFGFFKAAGTSVESIQWEIPYRDTPNSSAVQLRSTSLLSGIQYDSANSTLFLTAAAPNASARYVALDIAESAFTGAVEAFIGGAQIVPEAYMNSDVVTVVIRYNQTSPTVHISVAGLRLNS